MIRVNKVDVFIVCDVKNEGLCNQHSRYLTVKAREYIRLSSLVIIIDCQGYRLYLLALIDRK